MRSKRTIIVSSVFGIVGVAALVYSQVGSASYNAFASANGDFMVERGKDIFRFDTFGDENFWGGQLRLHDAIAGSANGGVGPGVSPVQALQLGLKVDASTLPVSLVQQSKAGQ